jgi:F0F1-type ATP synthase assembly protein I
MSQFLLKTLISALLIAGSSELARRSTLAGALLVSLPLTSLFAILWLWRDSHDPQRVAAFAAEILWLVLPSLLLFIVLPLMLRLGYGFWLSLGCGVLATIAAYSALVMLRGGSA